MILSGFKEICVTVCLLFHFPYLGLSGESTKLIFNVVDDPGRIISKYIPSNSNVTENRKSHFSTLTEGKKK